MKRKSTFFVFILISLALLLFTLVACGDDDEKSGECNHKYNGVVTKEASCTAAGEITYTCSRCEESYTEEVSALGHDIESHSAVSPTCSSVGWDSYVSCKRNGCGYTTYSEKPMTEHKYSDKLFSNSTHHFHKCACGLKKDEALHTPSGEPTLTEDETCTACGYVITAASGISFNTLSVDGTSIYGKVSNATEAFSFADEIKVVGSAEYVLSSDEAGKNVIADATVSLEVGDNTVYVTEYVKGEAIVTYTVVIRRRPVYTVSFDTAGGTPVPDMSVEEDGFILAPTTQYEGYTLSSWNYDFSAPIVNNTHIVATWKPNPDTKYTVEYYLQNLGEGYTLTESKELAGVTNETANAEKKTFEHFTLNSPLSIFNGTIAADGSLVLKLYYTRDVYTVKTSVMNERGGSVSEGGTYPYGTEIKLSATAKDGYTFYGYLVGNKTVCSTAEYTFTASADVEIVANITADEKKYTVEYYLENIGGGYTLSQTKELVGHTDETVSAEIESIGHFTFNPSISITGGEITADSVPTLKMYYLRNVYSVRTVLSDKNGGNVTAGGTYPYGTELKLVSTVNLGYEFAGYFINGICVCDDAEYEFVADADIEIVLSVDMKPEMQSFVFTSNENECFITGIKDKTVREINVPEYVTRIGLGAFGGCDALESICVPFVGESIDGNVNNHFGYIFGAKTYLLNKDCVPSSLQYAKVSVGGKISKYAFFECAALNTAVIPDGITVIDSYAFSGCTNLTEIRIPNNLTRIGAFAFAGCENLGSVTLPDGLLSIENGAFSDCSLLYEITVPDSVTSIGKSSFMNCDNLVHIVLPFVGETRDTEINSHFGYVFGADSYLLNDKFVPANLSTVIITSAESIGRCAFKGCKGIAYVTLCNDVERIEEYAFFGCTGLYDIIIGNGTKNIDSYAFADCVNLYGINVPDSVTSIGRYCFANCHSLQSITLPFVGETKDSDVNTHFGYIFGAGSYSSNGTYLPINLLYVYVTCANSIGDYAFYGCESLLQISLQDGPLSVGNYAFAKCTNLRNVDIPESVESLGSYAFRDCRSLNGINLPNGVTVIEEGVFYGCTAMENVYFGGITEIKPFAFYGCETLYEIELNSTLNRIGASAFENCMSLSDVSVPRSVRYIGMSAFRGCVSLLSIDVPFIGETPDAQVNNHFGYIFGAETYSSNKKFVPERIYMVYVSSGAESISNYAFYGCAYINRITIPLTVTRVGASAFAGCNGLGYITLPFIGELRGETENNHFGYVFGAPSYSSNYVYVPENLRTVTVLSGTFVGDYAFYGCSGITKITLSSTMLNIGNHSFSGCSSLRSLNIPNKVQTIGDYAFSSCRSLEGVIIRESVVSIGNSAFLGCTALTHANFYEGLLGLDIGDSAFSGCTALTNITLPERTVSVGRYAFQGCENLESIELPFVGAKKGDLINNHFGYIFGAASYNLNKIYVPSGLRYVSVNTECDIGNFAFYGCDGIRTAHLYGVKSIGSSAFAGCSALEGIYIEGGVTKIGSYAFSGCTSLTGVDIPDTVESIGKYAFLNCSSLETITVPFIGEANDSDKNYHFGYIFGASYYYENHEYVPESLKQVILTAANSIRSYAFFNCRNLEKIDISDSVKNIEPYAFSLCESIDKISIPKGVEYIDPLAFEECRNLTHIDVYELNDRYMSIDGNVYTKDGETLVRYAPGKTEASYEIPYGVKYIGNSSFSRSESLESVIMPDSVTAIYFCAFEGCARLENVRFSACLISIEGYAFFGCISLTDVVIPDGVEYIGDFAFNGCSGLVSIVIPNSVTLICSRVFGNCGKLSIFCETGTQSDYWATDWNPDGCTVYWDSDVIIKSQY